MMMMTIIIIIIIIIRKQICNCYAQNRFRLNGIFSADFQLQKFGD